MKKILIILAVLTIILLSINKEEDYVVIPKESIRFRIIPNSNAAEDLYMKEKVKTEISETLKEIENENNINDTREKIKSSIPIMENKIENLFTNENYNQNFKINYGLNYFPEKIYKGVKYESGEYESMVIEIGNKSGDNYWCVLFPPLCLLEAEESEEVEYKFFVKELIKKVFN